MTARTKAIAFDLDGTLTQHRSPLQEENKRVLDMLSKKYRLLMVGAGMCRRIFMQMNGYPIDIIGNYGMQYARYDGAVQDIVIVHNDVVRADRTAVESAVAALRKKFGCTEFAGEGVEFHASGCITFPLLGTQAALADKLAYDPDRRKRRSMYAEVCRAFPGYTVFVGGSSSFDMAPEPYHKYYALDSYCRNHGYAHDQVVYVGDDYGPGGNDETVYTSDFPFVTVDDYRTLPEKMKEYLDYGD